QHPPSAALYTPSLHDALPISGNGTEAARGFEALLPRYPDDSWLLLGLAEAEARQGRHAAADARFEALVARMPRNRAVVLAYAGVDRKSTRLNSSHVKISYAVF